MGRPEGHFQATRGRPIALHTTGGRGGLAFGSELAHLHFKIQTPPGLLPHIPSPHMAMSECPCNSHTNLISVVGGAGPLRLTAVPHAVVRGQFLSKRDAC